ncbi:environmental stress-induced protein Ves [Arthrobacter globiformis]|uniref:HutD/Ves family protein n=1 Tax=Arthrobacter globiformis TaxID=1665 RepID=UPI00277EAB31|nr:HutD family protein [Arthrobacter globiformis]MDQ1060591.1 environmental stress-induced protein Ves [Arthrobacter globiformis]
MQIIRFADLKPQPWRNGGGVTRELASHRGDASAAAASSGDGAWDWRVSIADVTSAGEYSAFPGTERVLTVVEGELLLLAVDGTEHPLEKYRPFRFPGGAASSSALPTGDIRNLNVMAREGAFKAYTSIVELSKKRAHPVFEGQLGILLQGQATVSPGNTGGLGNASSLGSAESGSGGQDSPPVALGRYDAVVGSDSQTPEILGRGFLAVVSIDPVTD